MMLPAISLRAVEPSDVDFMLECESDAGSVRWSDGRAPLSRNQLLTYALTYDADPFSAGQLRLIVEDVASADPVGALDVYDISAADSRGFVGITVHPSFRRRRYALSALRELDAYNRRSLGLRQLAVKISVDNAASLALFERAGYRRVALLPDWHRIGTTLHSLHLLLR